MICEARVNPPDAFDRRRFLYRAASGIAALSLGGCDDPSFNPWVTKVLESAEALTHAAQRAVTGPQILAPEYSEADISAYFRPNGTTDPEDPHYKALTANNFADYRLEVAGLVEKP